MTKLILSKPKGLKALGTKVQHYKKPSYRILETFDNEFSSNEYEVSFVMKGEYTSLCPVTSAPDFGSVYITYTPDKKLVEAKSLKLYLQSYRNVGVFGEDVTNRILNDLVKALRPYRCSVTTEFVPRGGVGWGATARYVKPEPYDALYC